MNTEQDSTSPDDLLERAGQITEEITEKALECEEQGDFQKAAELYDKAARVWRQASENLSGKRRDFCLSLSQYWEDRANEACKQAAVEDEEGRPRREPHGAQLQGAKIRAHDLTRSVRQSLASPGIRTSRSIEFKGFPRNKGAKTRFTPPPVHKKASPVEKGKTSTEHPEDTD